MPSFQYFRWVGSFLLAAPLAANWWFPAPTASTPAADVPLNQRINIRIHTDHRRPDRVVFDTTRSPFALEAKVGPEADVGPSKTVAQAEHQPFDAFAQMAAFPVRPCFRPPCSAGQGAEREASPIGKGAPSQTRSRLSITARKGFTFPNPLHKQQGRS
jgi:hypothetical protein